MRCSDATGRGWSGAERHVSHCDDRAFGESPETTQRWTCFLVHGFEKLVKYNLTNNYHNYVYLLWKWQRKLSLKIVIQNDYALYLHRQCVQQLTQNLSPQISHSVVEFYKSDILSCFHAKYPQNIRPPSRSLENFSRASMVKKGLRKFVPYCATWDTQVIAVYFVLPGLEIVKARTLYGDVRFDMSSSPLGSTTNIMKFKD